MTVILLALAAALMWWASRFALRRRIDRQFGSHVSGGRSGTMIIDADGRKARAEYEVGRRVDFIVYESSFGWADGTTATAADRAAVVDSLKTWMRARGSSLEIAE
jgi:hypothetical protein